MSDEKEVAFEKEAETGDASKTRKDCPTGSTQKNDFYKITTRMLIFSLVAFLHSSQIPYFFFSYFLPPQLLAGIMTATKGVIPLPHERARNNVKGQGWHATTVKQSTIPGAGYGRFSDVDVPKGTVILTKSVIPMTEVSSIHSVANDVTLLFKNEGDFEKFISLYETEGQRTRDDIINFLPHFVFPHPNLDGVGLNFVSCSNNHGDPSKGDANFRFIIKDDYFIAETVADVKAGDELLLDYRDLGPVKEFWAQFCEKKGLSDVIYQKYSNFFAQINKTPHK